MSTAALSVTPGVKIKNILFATDFSDASLHALPFVTCLAKKMGASICLCHIVTPNALVESAPEVAPALYDSLRKEAEAELGSLAGPLKSAGLAPRTILRSGPICDELREIVANEKIDLVVAGTHGRTGVRRMLLGSVVEEICRVAECAVLTVGPSLAPRKEIGFKRILFPTDLSEDSRKIVPYLRGIAEEYRAKVTVLHILPEDLITNPDAPKLAEPIRRTMIHTLEKELAGLETEFLIGFGDTVEAILSTARSKGADLIAMGIHNAFLPGIQLRSSVVYRILAGAECPVLTYR
ncbi:MAG TPA: universal stress protein [Candidatus Angelobacter sp.]|nr:universal stress protein [Candidatus Angelobacter sp.]